MPENELAEKLYDIQNGKCFICEKPLDLVVDKFHIDHIIPKTSLSSAHESLF